MPVNNAILAAGADPPEINMQAIYERLENVRPDNIDISSHFTTEELRDMPTIEQNRYKSIKLNYLVMLEFGLPAHVPEFMRKKRRSKCPPPVMPSDSDSDEEWKPRKAKPKDSAWRPPPVKLPKLQKAVSKSCKKISNKKETSTKKKIDKSKATKVAATKAKDSESEVNSDHEEFMGFDEAEVNEQECFLDSRIESLVEAITKLDCDEVNLSEIEEMEPTVLKSEEQSKTKQKENSGFSTQAETIQDQNSNENPKSPRSNNLLAVLGYPSLSQSSNTDLTDLLNTDPLDSSDVDPKSWDSLYSSIANGSPVMQKNAILPQAIGEVRIEPLDGEEEEEVSALVRDCYPELQSTPAGKLLDLAPSQSDSGLGDNSVVSSSDLDALVEKETEHQKTKKNNNQQDGKSENQSEPRYPRRSIQRVNYKDLEVPEDDEFIWCEDCQTEYKGDCPVCGPLVIVEDTPASEGDPQYASKTIPDMLFIGESSIPGAGSGVFTRSLIKKGVRFGPYQGVCLLNEEEAHESGYSWEIQRSGKTSHFVDARAVSASNWMRYVNCARNSHEQNLLAFQYCGNIYYRSLRDVRPGEELLVWYGESYGEELGLTAISGDLVNYWNQDLQGFQCPQYGCNALYTTSDRLIVHLLLRHKIILTQTRYPCPHCRRSLLTETQLHNHVPYCKKLTDTNGVNNAVYKHHCDVCNMGFKNKEQLRQHIRTHTGERPYPCNICGKAFTQKGHLNTHMKTHTGEKPFKCNECGKGFSRKENLKKHMGTHTGEKPYQCHLCDRAFTQNSNLNKHMRLHTGDKPYKCNVCGMAFTQSNNLDKHKLCRHTDEKDWPHHCDECGKGFVTLTEKRQHIVKCHS